MNYRQKRTLAILDIADELKDATKNNYSMVSPHEGFAILQEEVEELWEEIKKKPSERSVEKMRKEATQVAAMAIRFMIDLT